MSRWYSNTTQIAWVCHMLIKGKKISHACEFVAVKGWRLAAVIHQLLRKHGWPVMHEDKKNGVRFYFLAPKTDPKTLQYPKSYKDYLIKVGLLEKKGDAPTPPPKKPNK